jgi:hypothetical protein
VADDSKHVSIDMTYHKRTNYIKAMRVTFQIHELIPEVQLLPIDLLMRVQRQATRHSTIKTDFVWSILIITSLNAPNTIDDHLVYKARTFHAGVISHSARKKA